MKKKIIPTTVFALILLMPSITLANSDVIAVSGSDLLFSDGFDLDAGISNEDELPFVVEFVPDTGMDNENNLPSPTEPIPSPTEPIPEIPSEKMLSIDNENVYEKMNKSYDEGYYPTVQNGAATLVLPLIASGDILNNKIRVKFDLGSPDSSPFRFDNYDKTVMLQSHPVNNGTNVVNSFLISLDIPLIENWTEGRFLVDITTTGQWADGSIFKQEFPLYVTLIENADSSAVFSPRLSPTPKTEEMPQPVPESGNLSKSESAEEQPVPQAKILLESFSVNPSSVMPGEEFSISAVFRNTNKKQSLNNVKITVTGETTDVIPAGGDDTGSFYFESIPDQGTATINMKMKASYNAKTGPHKIKFSIEYEGHKSIAYTASEEALVQIMQPVRLEFDEPQIPKEVNAGDTISISMNVMNLGLNMVHNVRMTVRAQGLLPEKTVFLGNIESGAAKKGDLYAFVETLNMSDSKETKKDNKYGMTHGNVILIYEDEYGQEYTNEFGFRTNINPPVILTEEESEKEEKPKNQGQWWISVIIVAGIIVIFVGVRIFDRKKKERIRRQEDDDFDDDLQY